MSRDQVIDDLIEENRRLAVKVEELERETRKPKQSCGERCGLGHDGYWRTLYGNCMACKVEAAEAKLAEAEQAHALELRQERAEFKRTLAELQEHERQTHERLGAILGTDDSLEQCAKRMEAEMERLRATIDAIGEDAEADRTTLDQKVALAKIRSRVSNIQRAALAPEVKP